MSVRGLCVAVDNAGNIVTSTDPSQAWNVAQADVGNAITGVSCPSVGLCVAVDSAGNVLTSSDPTGGKSAWAATNVISSAFGLVDVSCPSAALCVAISESGRVVTSTDPTGGASAWSTAVLNAGDLLFGVSCPSVSLCVVTGGGAGGGGGVIFSAANPAAGASAWTAVSTASTVEMISCPSTTFCMGIVRPTPGSGQPQDDLISSSDPGDGTSATWTNENVDGNNLLNAVSCLSASSCVAVDANGNVLESSDPTGGASAWTNSKVLSGPSDFGSGAFSDVECVGGLLCLAVYGTEIWATFDPTAGSSGWFQANLGVPLYGASCASVSFCAAVDDLGNVLTTTSAAAGGPWAVTHLEGIALLSVSCPAASLCVASDVAGDLLVSTDPAGGAASWSTLNVDGSGAITWVSCPTSSFCAAVDDSGDVLTSTSPAAGAGAWAMSDVDENIPLDAISCTGVGFCAAVDAAGAVLTSIDPTAGTPQWSSVEADPTQSLLAIDCPSSGLCVATDDAGNVLTSTDPTGPGAVWSSAPVDNTALTAVSCASTSQCVAVDDTGFEVNSIDPTGGAEEWTGTEVVGLAGLGSSLYAISCPDSTGCLTVDGNGSPWWGGPTPSNLTSPSIAGQATQGDTLSEQHGTWTDSPTSYSLQWERCSESEASCTDIANATGSSYVLTGADVGSTIRVSETASNANGDGATVESPQTAVVQSASLSGTGAAAGSGGGAGNATIKHATTSGTTAKVQVSCAGAAGATCSLVLRLTVKETIKGSKVIAVTAKAKTKKTVVILATTTVTLRAGQRKTVDVLLNSAGKRLLSQWHTLKVKLAVTQSGKPALSTTIRFEGKTNKKH